jgi:DNA-binding CsgD family transcriptional regulator
MYLTGSEQQALRGVFTLLAQDRGESDIRERLGWALLDLLHADQFASFVWNAESSRFDGRVALNMDPANLDRYGEWHQHHDPITFVLQSHRRATRVTDVMPQRELMKTEFFTDFLSRDGLHWGMNLHAFEGTRAALSAREQEVARAVCEGLTDKEIARRMAVSVPTVRTYLRRTFDKLGIERRSALAGLAKR